MNHYPVRVRAERTAPPGRWRWLVKWVLLITHYLVRAVLWAFVALPPAPPAGAPVDPARAPVGSLPGWRT